MRVFIPLEYDLAQCGFSGGSLDFVFLCFVSGSHYVAQVGLELVESSAQTPQCWDDRCLATILSLGMTFRGVVHSSS